ncbi:hypothetical protein [Nostoc sp.]|uniref:hypothetical protein n=1 Tax=Nostoc sp. TaxID=1180 RepID=UPI002FF03004
MRSLSLGGYAIALLSSSHPVEKLEMPYLRMIMVNQGKFAFSLYPISFPSA